MIADRCSRASGVPSPSARAIVVWLAIGLLAAAGCGSRTESPAPTTSEKLWIRVQNIDSFPVKILVKDQLLASYDRNTDKDRNTSEAEILVEQLPAESDIKVLGLHPDGWQEGVASFNRSTSGSTTFVTIKKPAKWETIGMYYDNRGGAKMQLYVGQLPCAIKADSKGELYLARPTTAASATVRLGDQEVGTLWPAPERADSGRPKEYYLIDLTGKRSYRYQEVYYTSLGISAEGAAFLEIKPVRGELSPSHVHRVPAFSASPATTYINFFLERAPQKIELKQDPNSPGANAFVIRSEIVEK